MQFCWSIFLEDCLRAVLMMPPAGGQCIMYLYPLYMFKSAAAAPALLGDAPLSTRRVCSEPSLPKEVLHPSCLWFSSTVAKVSSLGKFVNFRVPLSLTFLCTSLLRMWGFGSYMWLYWTTTAKIELCKASKIRHSPEEI